MTDAVCKAAAVCLIGTVLAAALKRKTPELALLVSLTLVLVVGTVLLRGIAEILTLIEQIMNTGGLPRQIFQPLLKTVGIAVVSRLGSDLCKDAGESAAAAAMESVGAVAAVVVALPLFEIVWSMLRSML